MGFTWGAGRLAGVTMWWEPAPALGTGPSLVTAHTGPHGRAAASACRPTSSVAPRPSVPKRSKSGS